jgi:hypothetical protein
VAAQIEGGGQINPGDLAAHRAAADEFRIPTV